VLEKLPLKGDLGYLLVFREKNLNRTARLKLWSLAGKTISCQHILGYGQDFSARVDSMRYVTFSLPEEFSFALYRYEIQ